MKKIIELIIELLTIIKNIIFKQETTPIEQPQEDKPTEDKPIIPKEETKPQEPKNEPKEVVEKLGKGKVMFAKDFVNKAKDIANNYKTIYIMGCFGSPMNSTNKKRYTTNYDYNKKPERTAKINNASADTFGFDCVCLIKGILWGWSGNKNKTYGGAVYASNSVPDIGADTMITSNYCEELSTNFSNIKVGEVVWLKGHIGIYVGDDLVVECTPIWKDGVQITSIKSKSGYNKRTWTKHGKLKYIDYSI